MTEPEHRRAEEPPPGDPLEPGRHLDADALPDDLAKLRGNVLAALAAERATDAFDAVLAKIVRLRSPSAPAETPGEPPEPSQQAVEAAADVLDITWGYYDPKGEIAREMAEKALRAAYAVDFGAQPASQPPTDVAEVMKVVRGLSAYQAVAIAKWHDATRGQPTGDASPKEGQ